MEIVPTEGDAGRFVRVERNIPVLPLFWLKDSPPPESIRYDLGSAEIDGRTVKREMHVNCVGGIPSLYDRKIFVTVLFIAGQRNALAQPLRTSTYEIASVIRQEGHRERITKSIERLVSATYKARASFYQGGRLIGRWQLFHLLERVGGAEEMGKTTGLCIKVGEDIARNYRACFYSTVDFEMFLALPSATAQGLFLYLNATRQQLGDTTVVVQIQDLQFGLPVMAAHRFKVRQILRDAVAALRERGCITDGGVEKEYLYATLPPTSFDKSDLFGSLLSQGVAETVARALLVQYPTETVRNQLRWLVHRNAKNPPALLVKAIQQNWSAPAAALKPSLPAVVRPTAPAMEFDSGPSREIPIEAYDPAVVASLEKEAIEEWCRACPALGPKAPSPYVRYFIGKRIKERGIQPLDRASEADLARSSHDSLN